MNPTAKAGGLPVVSWGFRVPLSTTPTSGTMTRAPSPWKVRTCLPTGPHAGCLTHRTHSRCNRIQPDISKSRGCLESRFSRSSILTEKPRPEPGASDPKGTLVRHVRTFHGDGARVMAPHVGVVDEGTRKPSEATGKPRPSGPGFMTTTDAGTEGPPRREDLLRRTVHLLLTVYLLPAICLVILVGLIAVLADGLAKAVVRLAHQLPRGRGGRFPANLAVGERENRPRGPHSARSSPRLRSARTRPGHVNETP
jgi:hypothetical protein